LNEVNILERESTEASDSVNVSDKFRFVCGNIYCRTCPFSEVHFTYISHCYTLQKVWIVIITADSTSCLAIKNATNCLLNKYFVLLTIFV